MQIDAISHHLLKAYYAPLKERIPAPFCVSKILLAKWQIKCYNALENVEQEGYHG